MLLERDLDGAETDVQTFSELPFSFWMTWARGMRYLHEGQIWTESK